MLPVETVVPVPTMHVTQSGSIRSFAKSDIGSEGTLRPEYTKCPCIGDLSRGHSAIASRFNRRSYPDPRRRRGGWRVPALQVPQPVGSVYPPGRGCVPAPWPVHQILLASLDLVDSARLVPLHADCDRHPAAAHGRLRAGWHAGVGRGRQGILDQACNEL